MNYLDYRKLMIQKIAKKGIHKIDFLKRRTEKELEEIRKEVSKYGESAHD